MWRETIKESVLNQDIPFFGGRLDISFHSIFFTAYFLLLGNPITVALHSVPWKFREGKWCNPSAWKREKQHVKYKMYNDPRPSVTPYSIEANDIWYNTLFHLKHKTSHKSVMMLQCTLARMEAVDSQDTAFMEEELNVLKSEFRRASLLSKTKILTANEIHQQKQQSVVRYLTVVNNSVHCGIVKFVCIGLVQNTIQTNIQISMLALNTFVTNEIDYSMLFSISTCVLSILGDWPDLCKLWGFFFAEAKWLNANKIEVKSRDVAKSRYVFFSARRRFFAYTVIYVSFVLWSFFKLYFVFRCPDSLWNFHPLEILDEQGLCELSVMHQAMTGMVWYLR